MLAQEPGGPKQARGGCIRLLPGRLPKEAPNRPGEGAVDERLPLFDSAHGRRAQVALVTRAGLEQTEKRQEEKRTVCAGMRWLEGSSRPVRYIYIL